VGRSQPIAVFERHCGAHGDGLLSRREIALSDDERLLLVLALADVGDLVFESPGEQQIIVER
jgi:hypothetical protein